MIPKYIYQESVRQKHCLNPMRLTLYLAMGSDRTIAKQGEVVFRFHLPSR